MFKVLANPLFLLLTFSVVTGRTAMRAFGMLVPAFGESLGLDKETSTYLLTIMAVADFISRRRTSWVPSWYYWSGFSPLWQLRSWSREWGRNGFLLFSFLAWLLLLGSLVNEYFCWVKRQTLNLLNVLHEQDFNFTWKNTYIATLLANELRMKNVLLIYFEQFSLFVLNCKLTPVILWKPTTYLAWIRQITQ